MRYEIDISNRQQAMAVAVDDIKQAVQRALEIEGLAAAVLSISIVDDATIHAINREHLQHDYPTDVISFQLEFGHSDFDEEDADPEDTSNDMTAPGEVDGLDDSEMLDASDSASTEPDAENLLRADGSFIEGEIIASAETALRMASAGDWSAQQELTLYVIHGLLHICGYDDLTPDERQTMRVREQVLLEALGHRLQRPVDPE